MNATLSGTKRKLQHTTNSNGDTVIINKRFKLTIKEPIRTENLILNNNFPPAHPTPGGLTSPLFSGSSSATDSPAILPTTALSSSSPGSSIASSIASTPGIRSHLDVGLELCIMEPEGMDSISRKHRSSLAASVSGAGLSSSSLSMSSSSSSSSHKKGHSIAVDKGRRLSHELRECRARLNELKNSPEWVSFQPSIRQFIQNDQNMSKYPTIVRRILDLPTIEKYLDDGVYATARDFDADVILMLDNAITYHTKMNTPYRATIVPNAQILKKNYIPYERWTILHNRAGGLGSSSMTSGISGSSTSSLSHRSTRNDDGDDDMPKQAPSPTSSSSSSSSSSHKKKKSRDSRESAKIDKIDKLEKMLQGLGETMNDIKKRPRQPPAAASPRISGSAAGGSAAAAGSAAGSGITRSSSSAGFSRGGPGGVGKRNPTSANYKSPNGVKYSNFTRFKSTIDSLPRQRHINLLGKAFQLSVTPVLMDKDMVRHAATSVDIDFELLSESIIKTIFHEANDMVKKERIVRQKEDQFLPSQPRVGGPPTHPPVPLGPRMQLPFPRGPMTPRSPHSPMGPPVQHTPPAPQGPHMMGPRGPQGRPPMMMAPPPQAGPLQRMTTYPPKAAVPAPPRPARNESDSDSDSDAGSSSGSDSDSGSSDGSSSSAPDSPEAAAAPARAPLAKMPQLPPHLAGSVPGRYLPHGPQAPPRIPQKPQGSGNSTPGLGNGGAVQWNIGNKEGNNANNGSNGGNGGNGNGGAFEKFQEKMKEHGDAVHAMEEERKREAEKQKKAEEDKRKELEKKQSEERMKLNGTGNQGPADDLF